MKKFNYKNLFKGVLAAIGLLLIIFFSGVGIGYAAFRTEQNAIAEFGIFTTFVWCVSWLFAIVRYHKKVYEQWSNFFQIEKE